MARQLNIALRGTAQLDAVRRAASNTSTAGLGGHAILPPWLTLLVAAGLVDWLVTRTVTRLAIFLPKSPAMISAYQALAWLGQIGSTLAALLALAGVVWIVREEWRSTRVPWLGLALGGLLTLSLLFLVQPPGDWLLLYHGLAVACLLGLGVRALRMQGARRLAVLAPVAAMLAAAVHQAVPALYTAMRWPGPPVWGKPAFLVGEGLVVVGALALWWAYGRGAARRTWLLAALPVAVFAAAYLATPAMTATIVIWSNGLTLFLPWWLYAAALWLLGVTVLWREQIGDRRVAIALILLAAAGYAPQLTSQFFLGLIAVWLLHGLPAARPANVPAAI